MRPLNNPAGDAGYAPLGMLFAKLKAAAIATSAWSATELMGRAIIAGERNRPEDR